MQGNFSLSVKGMVDTEPDKPVIKYNGNMDINLSKLSYQDFPKGIDSITAHINFSEKDIIIKESLLKTGDSNISLSGKVNSYLESPELSVKVGGKVEMKDITDALPVFGEKIQGIPRRRERLSV